MNKGELLTRLPVWLSLGGYCLGAAVYMLSRGSRKWDARARLAWTIGCLAMLVHVAFAFHFFYDWRHDLSLHETARQTAEVFGWYWGGGLYINYAFITAWVADVSWWWRGIDRYRQRSWSVTAAWHGSMIFMFFNATAVFKTGLLRWLGVFICSGLILLWWFSRETKKAPDITQVVLQQTENSKV